MKRWVFATFVPILFFVIVGATQLLQPKVAVLPFDNVAKEPDLAWLPKAMSGTLAAHFGFVRGITVINRIAVYQTVERLPVMLPEQAAQAIATRFRADFVVFGLFLREGDQLTITAHLFRSPKVIATETVTGSFNDLLRLQDELTERLLTKMGVTPTPQELEAIRRDPTNSFDAYVAFSRAAHAWDAEENPKDDVDEAIRLLKEAIRLDPTFYKAYVNLGLAWERKDDLGEARLCYKQAIRHQQPNFPLAHYNLAGIYVKLGDYERALSECDLALRADPSFARAHVRKGFIHFTNKRYSEAIDAYQTALRIDPDYAMANNNLGLAYQAMGRTDEARRAFLKVLELNNDDLASAYAHNNLGNLLRQQGDFDGAIRQYQAALRLKPDYAIALANLGDMYARKGMYAEAVRCYEEALRLDPNLPRLRERLRDAQTRLKW